MGGGNKRERQMERERISEKEKGGRRGELARERMREGKSGERERREGIGKS